MEKTDYIMATIDEYFEILDRENKKRSEIVAKSLVNYLQRTKQENKFEVLKTANRSS